MDDLEMVLDGVPTTMHETPSGKLVVAFPLALPDASVTLDIGQPVGEEQAVKLAAGVLTALRSAGYITTTATNPQHPDTRRPDPIQGYASN